jgi:hypothetical protein
MRLDGSRSYSLALLLFQGEEQGKEREAQEDPPTKTVSGEFLRARAWGYKRRGAGLDAWGACAAAGHV